MIAISVKTAIDGIEEEKKISPISTKRNPKPTKIEFIIYDFESENISIRLAITMYLKSSSLKAPAIKRYGIEKACSNVGAKFESKNVEKAI